MPETGQRRRRPSSTATHKPKPTISRPRRTSTAKPGRFSRGWAFRTKPEPKGVKRVLGAVSGALPSAKPQSKKGGAAAAGGLALLAGGLAALRKRQDTSSPAPVPGPVTSTPTHATAPNPTGQPVVPDRP